MPRRLVYFANGYIIVNSNWNAVDKDNAVKMPVFNDRILEDIRNAPRNSIEEVIAEHLRLDRKGKDYVGLCPFHSDTRPSMYVSPVKGIFKCFACGAGGDVFKFIQLREGLSFPQAVESLAKRAGIVLEISREPVKRTTTADGLMYVEPADVAAANEWAMKFWQDCYRGAGGKSARDYVAKRRISEQMAAAWGLGFAPDSWDAFTTAARKQGFTDQMLIACGLVVMREDSGRVYDKFRNRLMFPIWDTGGRVIAFGGRTLGDDPAKYMNSPATSLFDKSRSLYGLDKARYEIVNQARAVVVEGYTDVMMCHQHGITNVVAALGTSFTQGHAVMLRRFAREIILVLDSDVAGQAASDRALEICLNENLEVRLAMVSEGKDPCEFLLSRGAEPMREILASAKDAITYKWEKFQTQFTEQTSIPQKKQAVKDFVETMAAAINSGAIDQLSKGLLIKRLSSLTGIESAQIQKAVVKAAERKGYVRSEENRQVEKVVIGQNYIEKAQGEVLESLLNDPKLFPMVETRISLSFFTLPLLRQLAEKMLSIFESDIDFTIPVLLGRIEDPSLAAFVVEMVDEGEKKSNYARQLRQAIAVLEENETQTSLSEYADDAKLNEYCKKLRASKNNLRSGIFAG